MVEAMVYVLRTETRGVTCRSDLANGRESTAAGGDGRRRGYGIVCLRLWHEARGARPGSSTRRTSSCTRTEPIPQAARASKRLAAPKADSTARSPHSWRVTGEWWRLACIPARAATSAPQMSTPACCEVARWSPTRASTPMRCAPASLNSADVRASHGDGTAAAHVPSPARFIAAVIGSKTSSAASSVIAASALATTNSLPPSSPSFSSPTSLIGSGTDFANTP